MKKKVELPVTLHPGDELTNRNGTVTARVIVTKVKSEYGERMYKLRYLPSGVKSKTLFTRDELHEAGCTLSKTKKGEIT